MKSTPVHQYTSTPVHQYTSTPVNHYYFARKRIRYLLMSAIFFTLFIACSDVDQADDSNKRQVTENRSDFCYPHGNGDCTDSIRTKFTLL